MSDKKPDKIPMKYFSCVKGRAFARPGKGGRTFIGCSLRIKRNSQGKVLSRKWVFHTDRVVAIPAAEVAYFSRDYARAFKDESLERRTEGDYQAFLKEQEAENEKAVAKRKLKRKAKGVDGEGDAGPGNEGDDGEPVKRRGRRKQPGGTE
jgi:hypothetical protein